ncbi:ATP-binding cassette domain-containing protein [Herbivorax sp. ANBcel31]|uniref:ABC transporter ATP-binding protein n=1 Tax=Herbivorax sp. ANBcel31 TaxID=3069754 RepID=UPI0027B5A048|nr:ATP-binding cassette domain-containing protein [Herbivorax sp. ANBcel31]MDQ2087632.1 ATP-binding cassette domain-containing protein [Herbivorax sp. ANBcel31]
MNIIEVSKLSKEYNGFKAVKKIDFNVHKGEIFGFLGPNGAGKTSTINMLTGLAKPTEGSIVISGIDGIKNTKKVQGKIGIVPDESNLYDEMSGFDNLVFCASLYGIDKTTRETRAKELLKQFSLSDTGNRPFKAYSKGMKRKLTIAAGIIHNPEILFLDEPTTGIDVESARQIRKLIQTLNQNGTTIFLTTHYIEDAERLCHRIGFIVDGKVIKVSDKQSLMMNSEKEHILEFATDKDCTPLKEVIVNTFPELTIRSISKENIKISSKRQISLMPIIDLFEKHGVEVYEAKRLRPSLEEIFLKITGLEIEKLKKEKESKK